MREKWFSGISGTIADEIWKLKNGRFPVILIDNAVRASYILYKLEEELLRIRAIDVDDLLGVDFKKLIPLEDRVLSNMWVIASGVFAAVNIMPAVINAIKTYKNDKDMKEPTLEKAVTGVSIDGIGRFVFAFADDTKYYNGNVRVFFNNVNRCYEPDDDENYKFEQNADYIRDLMTLGDPQKWLLYSLENNILIYDIAYTKNEEDLDDKKEWHEIWQDQIAYLYANEKGEFFAQNDRSIYEALYKASDDYECLGWIGVLTMELVLFEPYYALGTDSDKRFKGLKLETDYIKDQYIRKQTVFIQEEVDRMRVCFNRVKASLNEGTKNVMTGGGAVLGRPLASGGFGRSDVNAVYAGAEALDGLVGSNLISLAATMLANSKEHWDDQYAKLLTFMECIQKDMFGETEAVKILKYRVATLHEMAEKQLEIMKREMTGLDKELAALIEGYDKYLGKLDEMFGAC